VTAPEVSPAAKVRGASPARDVDAAAAAVAVWVVVRVEFRLKEDF